MEDGAKALAEAKLAGLIDTYWDLAFAEGRDGRSHDTEDGAAQKTRDEIDCLIRSLIEKTAPPARVGPPTPTDRIGSTPDAALDHIREHRRKLGRRMIGGYEILPADNGGWIVLSTDKDDPVPIGAFTGFSQLVEWLSGIHWTIAEMSEEAAGEVSA